MNEPRNRAGGSNVVSGVQTQNWSYEERRVRAVIDALDAAWEDAMEVGCMDHGGYEVLARAAIKAANDVQ